MRRNMKSQQCARKRILEVRGNKCEKCGYPGMVEAHHIIPYIERKNYDDDNLILLCEKCHAEAHGLNKKKYLDSRRKDWKP